MEAKMSETLITRHGKLGGRRTDGDHRRCSAVLRGVEPTRFQTGSSPPSPAEGGTYRDSNAPEGLMDQAIAQYADGSFEAFPDLSFDVLEELEARVTQRKGA
jgi:hypothetical protein